MQDTRLDFAQLTDDPYANIGAAVIYQAVHDARFLARFMAHPSWLYAALDMDSTMMSARAVQERFMEACDALESFALSDFIPLTMAVLSDDTGKQSTELIREEILRCVDMARRRMTLGRAEMLVQRWRESKKKAHVRKYDHPRENAPQPAPAVKTEPPVQKEPPPEAEPVPSMQAVQPAQEEPSTANVVPQRCQRVRRVRVRGWRAILEV